MMKKIIKFQQDAIEKIVNKSKEFLTLDGSRKILFKAPTGSGKTIMMIDVLNEIANENNTFIWISFNDENAMQSMKKFQGNENNKLALINVDHLPQDLLTSNSVFFINWQKIVSHDTEKKLLTKETEKFPIGILQTLLKNTSKTKKVILVIDEAHISSETALASKVVELINPKLTILVTATPSDANFVSGEDYALNKGFFCTISREEVVNAELIKDSVFLQSSDELLDKKGDVTEVLVEAAINKLNYLKDQHIKIKVV